MINAQTLTFFLTGTLTIFLACGPGNNFSFDSSPTDNPQNTNIIDDPIIDDLPIPEIGVDLGGLGHHFDVDSFQNTGGNWLTKEVCHVHEFDNVSPHYNVIDFLAECKPGKSHGFLEAIANCSNELKYRLENADRASGKLELNVDGTQYQLFAADSFSSAHGGEINFDWITHAGNGSITNFKLQPSNLEVMVGTQPNKVQDDADDRIGSFTIKVFCGTSQIWEFATYEHVKK